jgi:hypothetical protein
MHRFEQYLTFNFSAKYLSKKDSSTMLPELTEFVPATRMGIARKVLQGLESRAGCIFSLLLNGEHANHYTLDAVYRL